MGLLERLSAWVEAPYTPVYRCSVCGNRFEDEEDSPCPECGGELESDEVVERSVYYWGPM
ncbi:zinc ribbon domain-containing protein [Salinirubellus sp. GCM10025818]|jgi:rubrerythrin|uniref:zinc ribbon domain-containing protein n=1 Tax=Salinirubellus TaxID=2162630 RepID=UPI0030D4C1DF